jgi:5-oxoprolinase (ATP-hydrolysing)
MWQFWIDRGGTFTDLVAKTPDGTLKTLKLLSESAAYDDAAIEGVRRLLGLDAGEPIPPVAHGHGVVAIKMGTTVATNALLTRSGAPTLLAITTGFGDALVIGYQNRPKLFARRIEKTPPLYAEVAEIDERLAADGSVVTALDRDAAERALRAAYGRGLRAIAVALMHAWRNPAHERALGEIARALGFEQVTLSHEVNPAMKLVLRAETAVADAYLTPVVRRYAGQVACASPAVPLFFMQSSGGLAEAATFRGRDAVLSGPAGGIVGAVAAAKRAGMSSVVTFDMGGTSTDVAWWDGTFERASESTLAGVRLRAPMLSIHTVAAGGGSILKFEGGRLRVGPESAGADPGPACYRRGGPLTITDANVLLGRVQPKFFPNVFGPNGDQPLDRDVVVTKFDALAAEIRHELGRESAPAQSGQAQSGQAMTPAEIAEGFLAVAVENMAHAIKHVSIARGHDVTRASLVAFGGAGGQHACKVAETLGIERILIHPLAGMLSAFGIGLADLLAVSERPVEAPLDQALIDRLAREYAAMVADAETTLASSPLQPARIKLSKTVEIRIDGSDTPLSVPFAGADAMRASFASLHRRMFGFEPDSQSGESPNLIVESIRLKAAGEMPDPALAAPRRGGAPAEPRELATMHVGDGFSKVPAYARGDLAIGQIVHGPALIIEEGATTVIDPHWRAKLDEHGDVTMRRDRPADSYSYGLRDTAVAPIHPDPIHLEIFDRLFMAIAEDMGVVLANTAHSVNIKERLDFSCAIFDSEARLVANAPHMPVHLGSMDETVAAVVRAHRDEDGRPAFRPGDAFVHNAPYNGGTHLPDVTVVLPIFDQETAQGGNQPVAFVAARGHHADIGGVTPGSMPPFSKTIDDEGVLFDAVPLVRGGQFIESDVRAHLASGPHPARNPDQNIRDLKAQLAACVKGEQALRRAFRAHGLGVVSAYMGHVQDNAELFVRRAIGTLKDGAFACAMDDGAEIRVRVTVDRTRGEATVDFEGSSAQHPGNLNAPRAVTRAAVLYVFRTLVDADIPMNAGCLRPIRILVPDGSMLAPRHPAAVCAGNVETSQVVVDALFAALGVMAASQGTMNNFTFGDERSQYYETICGGQGAGCRGADRPDGGRSGFDGASAVHTHMTNSRLTDPEVLESRYPVRVESFAVRANSGGAPGAHAHGWRGGDGVVRKIRFLAPMTAAILSDRRKVAPFGLNGGADGARGRNAVQRANGTVEELSGTAEVKMNAGDVFIIETPGGGGCG